MSNEKYPTYRLVKDGVVRPEEVLRSDPKLLSYFRKKNPFLRAFDSLWTGLNPWRYERKEQMRLALLAAIDGYADHRVTMEAEARRILLSSLRGHSIYDKIDRYGVDVSVIKRDAEWWRDLLKVFVATGAIVGALLYYSPTPPDLSGELTKCRMELMEKNSKIDNLNDQVEALKASLEEASSMECPVCEPTTKVVRVKDKKCAAQLNEANKLLEEAANTIAALNKKLKEEMKKGRVPVNDFIRKVDAIFSTLGEGTDSEYYKTVVRPYFLRHLRANNRGVVKAVLFMGGEVLRYGSHLKPYRGTYDPSQIVFPGGAVSIGGANKKKNIQKLYFEYLKVRYNLPES